MTQKALIYPYIYSRTAACPPYVQPKLFTDKPVVLQIEKAGAIFNGRTE